MKTLQIFTVFLFCLSATAQQDTIYRQRKARNFLREGNKLYKQKKYADAAVSYKKATEQSVRYYKGNYNFGNALFEQKNYKEALLQYELSVKEAKTKKDKSEAYHNLGNAQMSQKEFEKAIESYKNSLRNNPSDDETRYNLAYAKQQLKKQEGDDRNNKKDPPSEYAKRMKKKADALVEKFKFKEALYLMDMALKKDVTASFYLDYMKKLESVIKIDNQK